MQTQIPENLNLDGLQAAILSVKLRHLDDWTERRRRNARRYSDALRGSVVQTPTELANVRAVYHLYVVRVPNAGREKLQAHLSASGISAGIHYPIALPYLNAYRQLGHTDKDFPEARKAAAEILSLPMYPELTADQTSSVARSIIEAPL